MFDTVVHKYLHLPYRLHVHVDRRVRRPRATVVLLHGIGDESASWDRVIARLPPDLRVLSVDLLGFGRSPAPRWLKYNIRVQALSVICTLLPRWIKHPVIIVGHSMGSLTAIDITKRYPLLVRSLVLCSPPLYSDEERRRLLPNPNKLLRSIYRLLINNPQKVVSINALVGRLKISGAQFNITSDNVEVFMSALEASIVDQTSLPDVVSIKKPIRMIHGSFDPLVIKKNLQYVVAANDAATLTVVRAGHELNGTYASAIDRAVREIIAE